MKKILSFIMVLAMLASQIVVSAEESGETVLIDQSFTDSIGGFSSWITSSVNDTNIAEWCGTENNPEGESGTGSVKIVTYPTKEWAWLGGGTPQHLLYNYGIQQSVSSMLTVGKRYRISAWIKGGEYYEGSGFKMGASIDNAPTIYKEPITQGILASDYVAVTDEWQKVEFEYECTDKNVYLRVNFSGKGVKCDPDNGIFATFYIDDVKLTELPAIPLEVISEYPQRDTLYNGEKITYELNVNPDMKSTKFTVKDGNGDDVSCKVTSEGHNVIVDIPDRVDGETYSVSGTVAAFGGVSADVSGVYTADNITHMNEDFAGNIGLFTQTYTSAGLNYTSDEDHTGKKNSGVAELSYATVDNDVKNGNYTKVGFERKITSGIESGKRYGISAWVKGASKTVKAGICNGISQSSIKNPIAGNEITASDEWQEISFEWTATREDEANVAAGKYYISLAAGSVPDVGDKFYFDDIVIKQLPDKDFEVVSVNPKNMILYNNAAAKFAFTVAPDAANSSITVTDGTGKTVQSKLSVTGNSLVIDIPNRENGEKYTVTGTVAAINGKTVDFGEGYTFTADNSTLVVETFDGSTENVTNKLGGATMDYVKDQNHTDGDGTGAVMLSYNTLNTMVEVGCISYIGFEVPIPAKTLKGKNYYITAWLKNKEGCSPTAVTAAILSANNVTWDAKPIASSEITVNDTWQKVSFMWNAGNLYGPNTAVLRIYRSARNQSLRDAFYCDDITITEYGSIDVDDSNSYPQNGQQNVSISDEYSIKFTKDIAAEKFEDSYVTLTDVSNKQQIKCDITVDGSVMKIKPQQPLAYASKYKLDFAKDISEKYETSFVTMEKARTIEFTTQNKPLEITDYTAGASNLIFKLKNDNDKEQTAYCILAQYDGTASKALTAQSVTVPANGSTDYIMFTPEGYDKDKCELIVTSSLTDENVAFFTGAELSNAARNNINVAAEGVKATDVSVSFDPETQLVTVKGQTVTGRKNVPVLIRVLPKTGNLSEVTADNINEKMHRAEVILTGEGGTFGYTFSTAGITGSYTVYTNVLNEQGRVKNGFNCATAEEISAAIAKLNKAEESNAKNTFDEISETLELNSEAYDSLKNKEFVAKTLAERKPYATKAEVQETFKKTVEIINSFETADSESVKLFIDEHSGNYYNIADTSAYKDFADNTKPDEQKKIIKMFAECKKLSEVSAKFADIIVTNKLKAYQSYDSIYSILESFSDVLNIDSGKYKKLSLDGRNAVCRSFAAKIPNLDTTNDVDKEFNALVSAKKTEEDDKSETGGGGTSTGVGSKGGSSYGGGTTFPASQKDNSVKVPDWYADKHAENTAGDTNDFDDLDSVEWAKPSIARLYALGVINGKAERTFAPNDKITRAEAAKMIVKALKLERPETSPGEMKFGDVDANAWYYNDVLICWENGILTGVDDNTLGVDSPLTREEFSTIICRAADIAGYALDFDITIFKFADSDSISDWALKFVNALRESDIIDGVGGNYFAPKDPVTRAQAAKIISSLLSYSY